MYVTSLDAATFYIFQSYLNKDLHYINICYNSNSRSEDVCNISGPATFYIFAVLSEQRPTLHKQRLQQ